MTSNNFLFVFCTTLFGFLHISGIELLQDIPLDKSITESTDSGKPIVIASPDSSQVIIL